MSKRYQNRKRLFDKYSNQLKLLVDSDVLKIDLHYENTYICPLCLDQFNETHLDSTFKGNFLTEEDAPPASLGGQRVALTCKDCNSRAGHTFDAHLYNRIQRIDESKFPPGLVILGKAVAGNQSVQVELIADAKGTMTARHLSKNNNPSTLDRFIKSINEGTIRHFNFEFANRKINPSYVGYSILKTSYILTFSKFGYLAVLDDDYQSMRDQFRNPNENIYPHHPYLSNQFPHDKTGTYYVIEDGVYSGPF